MRASVAQRAVVTWLLMLASLSQLSSAEPVASRVEKDKKVFPIRSGVSTQSASRVALCTGSAETGNCRAAILSWFYNTQSNQCEQFTYGGCGGNNNRHNTLEECRAKCEQTQQTVSPTRSSKQQGGGKQKGPKGRPDNRLPETATSIVTSTGGLVAVVVGTTINLTCKSNGTSIISWVFYPPHSLQVVNVFRGNKLNENYSQKISIDSSPGQSTLTFAKVKPVDRGRYECLDDFSTNDGVLFDVMVYRLAGPGACSGPAVTGKCRALIPKWYFDATTSSCRRFIYGGCDGTDNRYDSRPECESTCVGRPTEPTSATSPEVTTTSSQMSVGTEVEGLATVANRRGGGGEGAGRKRNRIETTKMPRLMRRSAEGPSLDAAANRPSACRGLAVPGRCRAAFRKWFYNEATGECQQFIYGGCGGSENRHNSLEMCENLCLVVNAGH